MNKHYIALELNKVLHLLAQETGNADAAALAEELTPTPYLSEANRLMAETDAAYTLMARFGAPSFGQLENSTNALRRAQAGAALMPVELLRISATLQVIRTVTEWRSRCAGVETVLDERFSLLAPNKYLEEKINASILGEDEIADSASPALSDIRRKMRAASARVREQLEKMVRSSTYQKFLQEPLVTIRDGRFVVPVKSECRGEIPGLVHDTSASGATVFVEPLTSVEANNELKVLKARESAEIERILALLSAEAGSFADAIIADYQILLELNLIFAKARLGYKMKAMTPRLTNDGHIYLHKARHPLIDPHTVVPIDVALGGTFDTLLITGPNTGGKTVTLKTLGLLSLMAMCGLMIPAGDGSEISVFDRVLADIGDEQSIEQSLSTFSAHMTNMIEILKEADDHSLVLTDELGAGTDPVEGAALAIAMLEALRDRGARIASTTHYAELKAYAVHTPGVENGSCEFDVESLRPTYRLLIGVPGRSNAFAISERLGMDKALVDHARELVSGEAQQLEEVVTHLDERRQALEVELEKAQEARRAAEKITADNEIRQEAVKKEQEKLLAEAHAQATRILDRARGEAQGLMDEIDDLRKQKKNMTALNDAKSRLRARLSEAENAIDPVHERRQENYVLPRPLKVGDDVELIDIDKPAVVLSLPDASGIVEVQAGIIRTRVPEQNLRLITAKKPVVKTRKSSSGTPSGRVSTATRSVRTELDLRGEMVQEALLEVDKFLDDAVLCGLQQVTIIHGKGTGALRTAVQTHLKAVSSVKSFRLGTYGEGETGVTIVEMK